MPPQDLVQVLSQLPRSESPDLLVGPDTLDDAGVYRLDTETGLVQTLDFFPPIVDDPRWFGRIAAANALSDVFAMGGRALTAMNIVGFPEELGMDVLAEILNGGLEKVHEAGATMVGGHSVRDREVKYGLSVTGLVHPEKIVTNAGAVPGDVLILTKPLGMGAISTAIKKELLDDAMIEAACAQMAELNMTASKAMCAAGVRSGTDVTGFGLMGHAHEMAVASGVTIDLTASSLPLFPGSLELVEKKILSGGAARTRLFLGESVAVASSVKDPLAGIAFDSETSGGLLMAVSEVRADSLLQALQDSGISAATVVGRVLPKDDQVSIRLE